MGDDDTEINALKLLGSDPDVRELASLERLRVIAAVAPRVRSLTEAQRAKSPRGSNNGMVRRGAACAADERGVTWECNGCGACCRALALGLLSDPEAARALDSGDGVCRHLERSTNRCRIYETRPACCRVTPAHAPEALVEGCRVLRLAIFREV